MSLSKPPVLKKAIPPQIVHEGAAFGSFDLKEYVESDIDSGELQFKAELKDGRALPAGVICTSDGLLNGIPGAGTAGVYEIELKAKNAAEDVLTTIINFTIKERLSIEDPYFLTNLKSKVWEALGKDLPLPEMAEIGNVLNRPISPVEIYYLLQRWATLTIWDVYNLDFPGDKQLIAIPELNQHYHIYDRGSCLVGVPKDLYSHARTLEDALQTARLMAREVYKRGWTIEFAGFNKMVRGAWVELQILGEKHGKQLEILHYSPSTDDYKIYAAQAKGLGLTGPQR